MPIITTFNGITIKMYYGQEEHNPPHIHAMYGSNAIVISIKTSEILAGKMPKKQLSMIMEWIDVHRDELQEIWETQNFHDVEPWH